MAILLNNDKTDSGPGASIYKWSAPQVSQPFQEFANNG